MTTSAACPTCGSTLPPDAPAEVCPRCLLGAGLAEPPADTAAAPPSAFDPEELAQRFPKLEILEQLGEGGMGVVFKARQTDLDRLVALKLLRPNVADDPAFAERFGREARALARLSHPNIVGVHEFGERDGLYFFVMEFVDGCTLREAMAAGALEPAEALRIVPHICDALQFAHDQGVVHRDIKPENVLIGRGGAVKIADFGLAKLVARGRDDFTLTRRDQIMGTPHYMAPEQIESPQAVDHRADIYSLGVVFYELLTGELPLGRFDPPSEKVRVDVRLDQVVLRTLEKERDRRYQHASEVRTTLESLERGGNGVSTPVPTPLPAEDGVRRPPSRSDLCRRAVVGLLLVVVSPVLAALAIYVARAGTPEFGGIVFAAAALPLIVGWVLCINGWMRIHREPERYHGKGFAVAGTFLPLLGCVGMLAVAPLMWLGARAPAARATALPAPIAVDASETADLAETVPEPGSVGPSDADAALRGGPPHWDVHDFAREKTAVLERVGAAKAAIAGLATAREVIGDRWRIDPDEAAALTYARSANVDCYAPGARHRFGNDPLDWESTPRDTWADAGFPLLRQEGLRSDIARYRVLVIEFDDDTGTGAEVVLQAPAGERITAHLEKVDGAWFFVHEQVRVEQAR